MADGQQAGMNRWHWVAFSLIILVMVILSAAGAWFMYSNRISDPKVFIAITLMSLFVLTTTTTLAIIFLWGAGVLNFSENFMHWLGGATVAEVAGILIIIVNFYFSSGQNPKPTPPPLAPAVQTAPAAPAQPAAQQ